MLPSVSKLAWVLGLVLSLGAAGAADSQFPANPGAPTISDMALDWARGRFATPLICEFDGKLVRGIRRVMIAPGASHRRSRQNRMVFIDLEVEEASRCFAELAGSVPNVTGSLQIELPAVRRSDTARRDFREALRRKKGFEFRIAEGGLKLQEVTQPPSPSRTVDFRGGSASLRTIELGSDAARLLAPFESPRKLMLELSARDGTKLSFPLYMTDLR